MTELRSGRTGAIHEAEIWLAKMKKVGHSPDVVTYAAMISACARLRDASGERVISSFPWI